MDKVDVKFNEWLSEGFNLYKENVGVLILSTLVAVILSAVTMGILAGPMFGGLLLICLKLHDKVDPKPTVGNVFDGFKYFVNTFLFGLVWGILMMVASIILNFIPFLGQLASLALGIVVAALLMFALVQIVDKDMPFWPASMESIEVIKSNFWPFLGVSTVATLIGYAGTILCGIGVVVTLPIWACVVIVAYRDVFGGKAAPIVEQPPVAPPESPSPQV